MNKKRYLFRVSQDIIIYERQSEVLLWVVPFDVGLNQRRMRKRTLGIPWIRIGVVVEQYHRLVLRDDTNRCYQLLEFVLQHPLITGQVNLLTGSEITQQFLAMNALTMPETWAILACGALQVLHVALREEGRIHIGILENLQTLPNAFNGDCHQTLCKWNWNTTIGIEGTELDELILCLARPRR